nr:hypothetical protein [Tanacetum cinerariifolium]
SCKAGAGRDPPPSGLVASGFGYLRVARHADVQFRRITAGAGRESRFAQGAALVGLSDRPVDFVLRHDSFHHLRREEASDEAGFARRRLGSDAH